MMVKVIGYVKENWGSPFIVGFMLLLLSAAFSLSAGLSSSADIIAVCGYYALVVGIVLQLVCFLKNRKKVGDTIKCLN
jgi:heme/copper-type cytochrome/quinol oxidase subunit 4